MSIFGRTGNRPVRPSVRRPPYRRNRRPRPHSYRIAPSRTRFPGAGKRTYMRSSSAFRVPAGINRRVEECFSGSSRFSRYCPYSVDSAGINITCRINKCLAITAAPAVWPMSDTYGLIALPFWLITTSGITGNQMNKELTYLFK